MTTPMTLEDQVAQLTAQTTALLEALAVRAADIQTVLGVDLSQAIRYCADHLTQILEAVNSAAAASADAAQTAQDRLAVSSDKAATLTAKNTAIENATLAVQKATEAINGAASAGNSANNAATILAQLQAALAGFRSLDLGIFASDADAQTYATANGITLHDGTMYQNSTGANKFRVWDGTQFKDYDATAQSLTAAAQVSAMAAAGSAGQAQSTLQQVQTVAQQVSDNAVLVNQKAVDAAESAASAQTTLTQTQQVKTDTDTIKTAVQTLYNNTATQTQAAIQSAVQAANSASATLADRTQTGLDKLAAAASANQAQQVLAEAVSLNPNLNPAIRTNARSITQDVTIFAGNNAQSTGPIDIAYGVRVTIQPGSRWKIN